MRVRGAADGIGEKHNAAGPEIVVYGIELVLIEWREVIDHHQPIVWSRVGGGDFDETVAQAVRGLAGIIGEECPVSRFEINIAFVVCCGAAATLPDAGQPAVWTGGID